MRTAMKYYLEITLLPTVDICSNFLWEKLYQKIHLGLVETKTANGTSAIGVAFPKYNFEQIDLGDKLRLFSPDENLLESFNAKKLLAPLNDYIHITGIRDTPNKVNYVRYRRQQSKSSIVRLARRKARHQNIEFEDALEKFKERKAQFLITPSVKIQSVSSKQRYRIFIYKETAHEYINQGFSCYGLSSVSTVPDF